MKTKFNRGFTLIELLVVIAIIGILSSVVLASLNTARSKGADASIKSNLAGARAQAELYYDSNSSSYSGVCAALSTATPGGIQNLVLQAAKNLGAVTSVAVTATAFVYSATASGALVTAAACHDSATGWAAIVSLKNTTNSSGWCVDSRGTATEATVLSASSVTCGS